ncbi:hypothetical protein BLD44_029830 [Mastigocladus laminosus UU774]|nr:hypothetical protein BLD44_029830 [Mastigocladus laminosus UU774]
MRSLICKRILQLQIHQIPDFFKKSGIFPFEGNTGSRFTLCNFVYCLSNGFRVFTVKSLLVAILPGNKTDKSPRHLKMKIAKSNLTSVT